MPHCLKPTRLPLAPKGLVAAAPWVLQLACLAAGLAASAQALSQDKAVYRCPGPPVLYTDTLSAAEARDRGCKTIEGTPITVVQAAKPRAAAAAPAAAGANPGAAARSGEARVDGAEQRARDSDAKAILAEELRQEEAKLAELQREFNGGEPERRGEERNFAKYQERVAALRASISRAEANIAALRRELAKK